MAKARKLNNSEVPEDKLKKMICSQHEWIFKKISTSTNLKLRTQNTQAKYTARSYPQVNLGC